MLLRQGSSAFNKSQGNFSRKSCSRAAVVLNYSEIFWSNDLGAQKGLSVSSRLKLLVIYTFSTLLVKPCYKIWDVFQMNAGVYSK